MARVKLLNRTDERRYLGRYEVIGEIASGGMATVHLARLAGVGGFQRFVAIKQLHPHLAGEDEFVEMFLDEARLAAGIHHPNVVPILEVGESEHGYFLVMEYIEGDTLGRLFARAASSSTPVPYAISLRVLLDTLQGLQAAHDLTDHTGQALNLVHRDCSPQNILVGVDGLSRLTDFGVARATSRIANTRSDTLKGKLAYMSPEQAKAMPLDGRSDLFAMGVILWESLAGRRLLKAESEAGTLAKILMEPLPTLLDVVPGIHPAFDFVAMQALARDPSKRFQTAQEMADAIEAAAREASAASVTDVGVASPREVAAFVTTLMGQDISAQRESVRGWVAQSEPSMVKPRERTSSVPQTPRGGFTATPPASRPSSPRRAPANEPDDEDLRTTGQAKNALRIAGGETDELATTQPRAEARHQGPTLVSEGSGPRASDVLAAAGLDVPVVSAKRSALGADDDQTAPFASTNGPGRDPRGETPRAPIVQPMPVPRALPLPPRSRDPRDAPSERSGARWPVALLLLLVAAGGGAALWWFVLRGAEPKRAEAGERGRPEIVHDQPAVAASAATPAAVGSVATPAPSAAAAPRATADAAEPRGPRPRATAKASAGPDKPPPPPPPTGDPDLSNPYK